MADDTSNTCGVASPSPSDSSRTQVVSSNSGYTSFFKTIISTAMQQTLTYYYYSKSFIYNTIILQMTEKWYRVVLTRVDDGSVFLDVGIGNGGALLRCKDVIIAKDLKIIGIDIDDAYVEVGKVAIQEAELSDRVSIDKVSIYDCNDKSLSELASKLGIDATNSCPIDVVYFSGSFSLLPDPVKALQLISKDILSTSGSSSSSSGSTDRGGSIYITQTYQRRTPFFLPYLKPLIKYVTTIDFGQLVKVEDVLETFKESGLDVVEHEVIEGSVDNSYQAAYLSILR